MRETDEDRLQYWMASAMTEKYGVLREHKGREACSDMGMQEGFPVAGESEL